MSEDRDFNLFVASCYLIGIILMFSFLFAFTVDNDDILHFIDEAGVPCFLIPDSTLEYSSYQNTSYSGGLAWKCNYYRT